MKSANFTPLIKSNASVGENEYILCEERNNANVVKRIVQSLSNGVLTRQTRLIILHSIIVARHGGFYTE